MGNNMRLMTVDIQFLIKNKNEKKKPVMSEQQINICLITVPETV